MPPLLWWEVALFLWEGVPIHMRATVCCTLFLEQVLLPPKADKFTGVDQPLPKDFDVKESDDQGLCVFWDGTWRPAIWHHELVTRLNKDFYGVHLYDIDPPRRTESQPPEDITTFLPPQKTWDFQSRQRRPHILFQLLPPVDYLDGRNIPVPWLEYDIDGVTKTILDIFSQRPLRDFNNIPLQLATNVEGGRLEAMCREDCRILTEDFLQRMIPLLDNNGDAKRDDAGVLMSHRPLKNALNNVKTQFRNKCRCLSWQKVYHDSEFDKQLLKQISPKDNDANTTRNLPDLFSSEITAIRSLAKSRKSKSTGVNKAVVEAAAEKSGTASTEDVGNQSARTVLDDADDTDLLKKRNTPAAAQVPVDPLCDRVLETGSVAQSRRQGRKYTNRAQSTKTGNPPGPTADTIRNAHQVIDPALILLAATAPPADLERPLALAKASQISSIVVQTDSLSAATTAVESATDALRRDQLALKRKFDGRPGNSDQDPIEVADDATSKPESSLHPSKRPRILPPTGDCHDLLKNFEAVPRPASAPFRVGIPPKLGTFTHTASRSLERRSESPQPSAARSATPLLANSAPSLRPQPHSSCQVLIPDQKQTLEAQRVRFVGVSQEVTSLESLKATLLKKWWSTQPNTSSGTSLYGPILNISINQLGPQSSARTDAEVRNLMSAYHIPPDWSASSINLRQHATLRQSVHSALCEADRWDERNYRKDFLGHLDLSTEGGFFLAPAQPDTIHTADSRFAPFTSQTALNASLHSAVWRYRQLTGRSFATTPGEDAFSTDGGVSYHDAWCEIRRQVFLPYFLRFKNPVEAVAWMPAFGMLQMWKGGPERWQTSWSHVNDHFRCRDDLDGKGALDPRKFWDTEEKVGLPVGSVDLKGMPGVVAEQQQ